MYQKKRNFVKGLKVLKRYIEAAPKSAVTKELLSMVGLSCTAMGDISDGLMHYRNAIALDPEYREPWLNLFQGLKECGRVCPISL
jgi:thiamine monophosphate kinase